MAEKVIIPPEVAIVYTVFKRRGFDVVSAEPLGDGRVRVTAITNTISPKFLGDYGEKIGSFLTRLKFGIANLLQLPSMKVEVVEEVSKVADGVLSGKYKITAIVKPLFKK